MMNSTECLGQIQTTWYASARDYLVSINGIQERFLDQVLLFYTNLIEAVDNKDPSRLDPILVSWVRSWNQISFDYSEISLKAILHKVFLLIFDISREKYKPNEVINIYESLLPVYFYANDFILGNELEQTVEYSRSDNKRLFEKSARIEETKTNFISVAAHELKTPLTLLRGYTTMLRELLSSSNISSQAEIYLSGIDVGYQRLKEIVDDLIDVSLIDNNVLPISFQPIWINQLLSTIKLEIAEIVQERHLTLNINNFPGSEEMTYGDGERLLQAFRKLIFNAIKYTPDGGEVSVGGRLLPGFIEISIMDTGIGIDPEDHQRIFNKFGRVGNPSLHSSGKTKFKGGGPGLGLSITRGIIEAHGGAIWVESEGHDEILYPGSTFYVLLPMRKAAPDDSMTKLFRLLGQDLDTKN
jgi:signal transduction histidine kinase